VVVVIVVVVVLVVVVVVIVIVVVLVLVVAYSTTGMLSFNIVLSLKVINLLYKKNTLCRSYDSSLSSYDECVKLSTSLYRIPLRQSAIGLRCNKCGRHTHIIKCAF